jgi:hypothetical protein
MTTQHPTRLPVLILGIFFAIVTLPSPGSAQIARIRLLTPEPIPVTSLTPLAAPRTSRSVKVLGSSGDAPSGSGTLFQTNVAFTTPSGGQSMPILYEALMSNRTFRTAVVELLRDGHVYETITLSDVHLVTIAWGASERGAEDEFVLFGSLVSTSGRGDLQVPSP